MHSWTTLVVVVVVVVVSAAAAHTHTHIHARKKESTEGETNKWNRPDSRCGVGLLVFFHAIVKSTTHSLLPVYTSLPTGGHLRQLTGRPIQQGAPVQVRVRASATGHAMSRQDKLSLFFLLVVSLGSCVPYHTIHYYWSYGHGSHRIRFAVLSPPSSSPSARPAPAGRSPARRTAGGAA